MRPTLSRTNTAPVFSASTDPTMSVTSAPRASQLPGSTIYPSTTSLSSLASSATLVNPPPPANGQVVATGNIINQRADASRSLYQICVALKARLAQVPGFEAYYAQLERMTADPDEGGPVESVWKLFRTGHPLLAIYNALQPEKPLDVEEMPNANEAKLSKIAILKFYKACQDLKLPATASFIIGDVTGDDTTGFVKVWDTPVF